MVGAPHSYGAGSAYVFVRYGTFWIRHAKLVAGNGAAASFGRSVAINSNTIVVGSPFQNSVHFFTRSNNIWWWRQKLTPYDRAANNQFGYSVAIAGEKVIVGAPNPGTAGARGSAYVLGYDVWMGAWFESQKLVASDGAEEDHFGHSVAINGNRVVIGAPLDDIGANYGQGSAYVFVENNWIWSQQQKLTSGADAWSGQRFGYSIAISGGSTTTVVVGAPGLAFVFAGN